MCFRFRGTVCLLLGHLAACAACYSPHASGEQPPTRVAHQADWEARIEAALDAKGDWEFRDVPLNEVCAAMQEKLGIDVALDRKTLDDFGIDSRLPVTRSLRGVSNRSFLRWMLSDLELTYTMRLGALWITTPEEAEAQLTTKVHPIGDLLQRDTTRHESRSDYSLLLEAIKGTIKPDTWEEFGGPASIRGIYDSIVVSQTSDVHEQVIALLAAYRVIISNDQQDAGENQTAVLLGQQEVNTALRRALDQPFTAEFKDRSLAEVVKLVSEKTGIPIVIDVRALEDFGIDSSLPITGKFNETPLRFALTRMLNEQELTYLIRDEVLFITTPEQAEASLVICFYPVRDLVEIADDASIEPLGARYDFDPLSEVIQSIIYPDSWDTVGGPGAIATLLPVPTMVISQTQDVHEQISELLVKLRAARRLQTAGSPAQEAVDPAALIIRSYPMHMVLYCAPEEVTKLVMRASDPGTWDDHAGTFIQGLGMSLVVKHNASGHHKVQKLLSELGVWSPSSPVKNAVDQQPAASGAIGSAF